MSAVESLHRGDKASAVRAYYDAWSRHYYDDYYGDEARYPPVHLDLILRLLAEESASQVLDAGCGPASILRHVAARGVSVWGFDLSQAMVMEARRRLDPLGVPAARIREGSVTSAESFRPPDRPAIGFDAILCIGVLPHIASEDEVEVFRNMREAVRPGGTVIAEARNALFSLFTMNRHSHRFIAEELVRIDALRDRAGTEAACVDECMNAVAGRLRMDLPAPSAMLGDAGSYDGVGARMHNPLTMPAQLAAAGLVDCRMLFFHYHCLPPICESFAGDLFRRESLAMEDPHDWRGHFMASAFLVVGHRP